MRRARDVWVAVNGPHDLDVAPRRECPQSPANRRDSRPETLPAVCRHHDQPVRRIEEAQAATLQRSRLQSVPHKMDGIDSRVSRNRD